MSGNYCKLLKIDLSSGKIENIDLDEVMVRSYVGGSSLAARLFFESDGYQYKPLQAESPMYIMAGPMVGTNFPGTSRFVICARSPLTGIWGESASGGFWGAELKKAGFDGIIIEGKPVVAVDHPKYAISKGPGPEYETCASFGTMIMNDDLNAVAHANELCNRLGLDTITCGATIAFMMDCYANGLLSLQDLDGLDLIWANVDAALAMVKKIAYREGFGDRAAEGSQALAASIGEAAEKYAVTVKGLELPMHDPRGFHGLGLAYMNSNRGACHLQHTVQAVEQGMVAWPEVGLDERGFPTIHLLRSLDLELLQAKLNSVVNIFEYFNTPRVAILDPRMTEMLPPGLTATTGMDAMTHAVESYVSQQRNPISNGSLTILNGVTGHGGLNVTADSGTLMNLSNQRIKWGLPYYFDETGKEILAAMKNGRLKVEGMLRHFTTLIRFSRVMSVH